MADIPLELIEHLSKEFSKACTPFDFKDSTIKVVEAACKETEKKEKKKAAKNEKEKKKASTAKCPSKDASKDKAPPKKKVKEDEKKTKKDSKGKAKTKKRKRKNDNVYTSGRESQIMIKSNLNCTSSLIRLPSQCFI